MLNQDNEQAAVDRDWVEEALPSILTEFGPALTECAKVLSTTGHAHLELPAGHVDAEVAKAGIFRHRVLRVVAYRREQQVMSSAGPLTSGEVSEGLPSAVLHLAVATANVMHETRG